MKPVQIVLLVVAGAMGGALVTRIWHRKPVVAPQPAAIAAAARPKTVPVQMSVPAASQPPAPAQATQAPPAADGQKASPMAPPEAAPPKSKPPEPAAAKPKPAAAPANNRAAHAPAPLKFHKNPPPAHPRPLELGQAAPMRTPAPAAAPPPAQPAAP